jgi:hypothetical protein
MYIVGASADKARAAIVVNYLRDADRAAALEPPRGGLPRLVTIEVTPEEVGPNGVRLDATSRAKLVAAGVDPEVVERELHRMERGDRKLLGDVVYGATADVPRGEIDEQVRWFGIAPTEEEEERIARGETVTFLVRE